MSRIAEFLGVQRVRIDAGRARLPHADPFTEMGRVLDDAEAQAGRYRVAADRYVAPRAAMPMALMARTCREAAAAIVSAEDRARARADLIDAFTRTLDNAISDEKEARHA